MSLPVIEVHQASPETVILTIDPVDLLLDETTTVRIEFREDLSEPVAGVMDSRSGQIEITGQSIKLLFTSEWLRLLTFSGPRRVFPLYGTLSIRGVQSGSADVKLVVTRSFTLGDV